MMVLKESVWTVIGAGPCGIASVGRLLDLNVKKVFWIDPLFICGRMGEFYRRVPANTLNGDLLFAMKLCESFRFDELQSLRRFQSTDYAVMSDLSPSECHPLSSFVDALEDTTTALLRDSRCEAIKGIALRINKSKQSGQTKWETTVRCHGSQHPTTSEPAENLEIFHSHAIVYSCGGKPIEISLQSPSSSLLLPPPPPSASSESISDKEPILPLYLSMDKMVDPQYCINIIAEELSSESHSISPAVWAVIGGSHSAMLVVKNLAEAGAKKIINIYRSDLRFMHKTEEGWLRLMFYLTTTNSNSAYSLFALFKFQGTGLKGPVGKWTAENLCGTEPALSSIVERVRYSEELSWKEQLSRHGVTHYTTAIGFERDEATFGLAAFIDGFEVTDEHWNRYDRFTGEIPHPSPLTHCGSTGLFGAGIAFPQYVVDGGGEQEPWVGFKRSIEQVDLMAERLIGDQQFQRSIQSHSLLPDVAIS